MRKLALLLALFVFFVAARAETQEAAAPGKKEIKKEAYTYTSEGRRDPFLSIIEATRRTKETKGKEKEGLEGFDLGQLKLIAIVQEKNRHLALVGLPDNKYYTIEIGTPIGIHGGKVHKITKSKVVVREFLPDYKGDIRPEDTILSLREEEGE
jgi:Tfp pilus assembly protein PilP